MTRRTRRIGRIAALLALTGLGILAWTRRGDFAPLDAGREAPAFRAVTLAGDSIGVQDYRGQVVLLNVWATWCKPCLTEMPALQRLYDQLAPQGFTVLAVSVDNARLSLGDPIEAVRGFVRELDLTFPILLDPENRIERIYQITGMPTTYLIDRDGIIRERIIGAREWDQPQLVEKIAALLNAEN